MRTLTKKEVKELKKRINEESIINVGYYYSIKQEITFDETMQAIQELNAQGIYLSKFNEVQQDNIVLTEIIRDMNYQEFKRRISKHIIGI